jgi:CheY-like chemotaxis protein
MNNESDTNSIILVVEDVNETRDGIEKLLKADGYRVILARDEKDANRKRPTREIRAGSLTTKA